MVIAAACGQPAPRTLDDESAAPSAHHDFAGRVATTETGLTLDGRTWFPAGFNSYQLGTDWAINVGCGAQVDLDEYFGKLPPRALTRFNLYSAFIVDKKTGRNKLFTARRRLRCSQAAQPDDPAGADRKLRRV